MRMSRQSAPPAQEDPAQDVVRLCGDLIRIDSSNYGNDEGPGERAAAEYVAAVLAECGLEPLLTEPEPGRTSVLARLEGSEPARPALLAHHHLDVVPAEASDWTVHPFSGEVTGGYVWGRGAVDMKNGVAATLAVLRAMRREGRRPRRDVVLAFNADEEAGGGKGVRHTVDAHPEVFEGCTEAIGEVGGFSVAAGDTERLYPVQVAEKGMAWMRLEGRGRAGHGSMRNDDNAVTAVSAAVARIGAHRFPARLTPAARAFLQAVAEATGTPLDERDPEALVAALGPLGRMIGPTLRHTANPTMLRAGYKLNVIPERAEAYVDGRFLPGLEEEFTKEIDELLGPDVTREWVHHDVAVQTSFDGEIVEAMRAAVSSEDPGARLVPYCMPGGTDAKTYAGLGIRCFGFIPLQLPPDLDFAAMFHGVDERVPVDALRFSVKVLDRFLSTC
jgi:acetylornithine deacetylase/succinyl-diaminopimelate desuccinylase-like protein